MTVYVVHPLSDKSLDISGAAVYGPFKYINNKYVYADELEGEMLPRPVVNKVLKAVDEFDVDHDYLLIAGDHLQIMAMTAALTTRWGAFRVLRYDRIAQGYIPVSIDFEETT